MSQILYPAAYPEGIKFLRTHDGKDAIHIGELPGGGWCRIDGQPIQSAAEFHAVLPPGPRLQQALEWWAHHDDEEPEWEPPAVTWKKGTLVYVDSGAELTSHAEIIQAYPTESPFQKAALEWFASRQHAQYQHQQREDLETGVLGGEAGPKKSHKKKTPAPTLARGSRIQQVMGAE